ncbi:MAG: hypothetical protein WAN74_00260 [Thermoplasmata archaeon]
MRKGLLIVGIGVAIVGATFIATIVSLPPPPSQISASLLDVPYVRDNSTMTETMSPASAPSANVYFSWVSDYPIAVSLYDQFPCAPGNRSCTPTTPLVSWVENASGKWSSSGGVDLPVYVVLTNNGSTPATVSGTVVATYVPSTPYLPTWSLVALVTGALVLLGIGAVAIFLGLFLRAGIYGRPPPKIPDSIAEDDRYLQELDDEPSAPGDAPSEDTPDR